MIRIATYHRIWQFATPPHSAHCSGRGLDDLGVELYSRQPRTSCRSTCLTGRAPGSQPRRCGAQRFPPLPQHAAGRSVRRQLSCHRAVGSASRALRALAVPLPPLRNSLRCVGTACTLRHVLRRRALSALGWRAGHAADWSWPGGLVLVVGKRWFRHGWLLAGRWLARWWLARWWLARRWSRYGWPWMGHQPWMGGSRLAFPCSLPT